MKKTRTRTGICQINKREYPLGDLILISYIREPILKLMKEKYPDLNPEGFVSVSELNKFRHEYVRSLVEAEKGELGTLEHQVMESLRKAEILTKNINEEMEERLTYGQKVADKVASVGGSWGFIFPFLMFVGLWMFLNVYAIVFKPFDPYPFILLNLVLSCIAAIQAPIIMMSQIRQEAKDRLRSEHDYQINLKAEVEIRQLHEKIDHLLIHQGQRLLDIQQIQIELIEQLGERFNED